MTVSCYVSEPGAKTPELMMFIEIPRIGELLHLPGRDGEFEVVRVRHAAQRPSGWTLPAVYVYLADRPAG